MNTKKIDQLFEKKEIINTGKDNHVKGLSNNSKDVKNGYVFFAVKGTNTDGHRFVEEAVKNGASAVVVQDTETAKKVKERYPDVWVVLTQDTRKKQAEVSRKFYGFPDRKIKIIGITGTNGKTTVSYLISQLIENSGRKTGIIGTIDYRVGDRVICEGRTTPDSIQWFRTLKQMSDMGAEYVVAEISSHALDQMRVYGTQFSGAVFTNLSQDHLDYHKSMEEYFSAKEKLFDMLDRETPAVVNTDDIYGNRLYNRLKKNKNISGIGTQNSPDFKIEDIKLSEKGSSFFLLWKNKKLPVKTKLIGLFNVYNTALSISILLKMGFSPEFLSKASENLQPVRGRLERIEGNGFSVYIDYAHTPDALKNVLQTLKDIKKRRLITVFGAGGDRDRSKRPLMGEVASELSDLVIITSDNPRTEDPLKIIDEIKSGIKGNSFKVIPDREKAIKEAIYTASEGDIVLIAGKGHENYQIIGKKTIPFDDLKVAKKYIKKRDNHFQL
ncbi:UDP-N-acetylmuramoyl-L-alanyl-D-glutamate--2,6-diaminopimelate ligase [Persephonella sp.]